MRPVPNTDGGSALQSPVVELWQLRYLVAVAEERSFTRAARRLHLSQQALSTAVRRLEDQLGCRLLERTSQRVEPTPAGQALVRAAPAVFAAVEAAVAAVHTAAGSLGGTLDLRYGLDSEMLVEERLAAFGQRHPALTLRGGPGMDADNLTALRQGEVDAVLAWVAVPAGLRTVTVAREEALLALPDRHGLAAADRVAVADVFAEPLVMFPRSGAPAVWDFLVGALRDEARPGAAIEEVPVSGQTAMAQRVLEGHGVCPVSRTLAGRIARPGLVLRPLDPPLQVPLLLAWRRESAVVAALAEDLAVDEPPT